MVLCQVHLMFTPYCRRIHSNKLTDIRNPICLAKLILDRSTQPLTLRRVPPNILVGEGARIFADKHGVNVVPNDNLISKNARDRFVRWQEDLKRADERLKKEELQKELCPNSQPCQQYETFSMGSNESSRTGSSQQRDHANAILTGTWNEGQPDSPYRGTPALEKQAQFPFSSTPVTTASQASPTQVLERSPLSYLGSSNPSKDRAPSPKRHRRGQPTTGLTPSSNLAHEGHRDSGRSPQPFKLHLEQPNGTPPQEELRGLRGTKRPFPYDKEKEDEPPMDLITDTVGAIAIDDKGRIAAGSSSGGIGMKHRGRLGPAALVGIGTAVVPVDPSDADGICVATVTSGTGEHMATTMASQRCAERIYRNTRRGESGQDIEEFNEDKIMESFVNQDFMGHPGVTNCNSVGAIGVMTVKKTKTGFYLYFAHNTDSFALASMGGSDKEPMCVMSRLGNGGTVTGGARKIRLE